MCLDIPCYCVARALVGVRIMRNHPTLKLSQLIQNSSVVTQFILWCSSIQTDTRSNSGIKFVNVTQLSEQERDKLIIMNWLARVSISVNTNQTVLEYDTDEITTIINSSNNGRPLPETTQWFVFLLSQACAQSYEIKYGQFATLWSNIDSLISTSLRHIIFLVQSSRPMYLSPESMLIQLLNDIFKNFNLLILIIELTSLHYFRARSVYLRRSLPPYLLERSNKKFNDIFRYTLLF